MTFEAFPDCPVRFDQAELDRLLVWAAAREASDVHLQSLRPVMLHAHGRLHAVTRRPLELGELQFLTNAICGEHAATTIAAGQEVNPAYSIRVRPGGAGSELLRFRVNGIGCLVDNQRGIHLVLRFIPSTPPPIATLGLPADLRDWLLDLHKGLVLITGPTGSGKTTLMASTLAAIAANPERDDVILTYEEPIEYLIPQGLHCVAAQSQIGVHVESWAQAVRNALRRAPRLILIGECRDPDTMRAALEACLTGHGVFTTLHTLGVPETVARIAHIFPEADRQQIHADLVDSLHLILSVRLVPGTAGRRVQLREYLRVDQRIRDRFYDVPPAELARATRSLLHSAGWSFLDDARDKQIRHEITDDVYRWIVRTYYQEE